MGRTMTRGRGGALMRDIARGALLGEYAPDLGVAGTLTEAALGFAPGFGTLCAARDTAASWRRRDWLGVGLNGLALLPVAGGMAKVVEVARGVERFRRVVRQARRRGESSR